MIRADDGIELGGVGNEGVDGGGSEGVDGGSKERVWLQTTTVCNCIQCATQHDCILSHENESVPPFMVSIWVQLSRELITAPTANMMKIVVGAQGCSPAGFSKVTPNRPVMQEPPVLVKLLHTFAEISERLNRLRNDAVC